MASRHRPVPVWLGTLWLLVLGTAAALHLGDVAGDAGVQNAFTFVLGSVGGLATWLWLSTTSRLPRGARRAVRWGGLGALALAVALVRVQGFSGSMVPRLAWRFGGARPELEAPAAPAAGLDLSPTPDDFPGFLGPGRRAAVPGARLARDWASAPPEELWRRPVGAGWSGFAVVHGVAVTLEQRGDEEVAAAYDAPTGAPLWAHGWPGHFDHALGGEGPRSTPTIAGGRVFALGAAGRLVCLDGASGARLWERDLLQLYGVDAALEAERVQYGRANSPLVLDGRVVVPAGGDPEGRAAGLVAFDAASGELVWESPPRNVSFASPAVATLAGRRQILIVNEASVSGHDPTSGALLWEHPWPGTTSGNASVSQAVPVEPERVFVSKGYGVGAALLSLEPGEDGTLAARELWHERRLLRTKLTNVVVVGPYVYGLSDGILECVDLERGERVWKGGRYGHGQVLLAGDLLLLLSEEGELLLIEPTPEEPNRVLGRLQVLEGKTWNNLALYGDLLLVRNGSEAAGYRLATR